jgi:hypothetical protein
MFQASVEVRRRTKLDQVHLIRLTESEELCNAKAVIASALEEHSCK